MLPNFHHERRLIALGHTVIGVDEAGCGCLFGPVIAAAVHLPLNSRIADITDSKLLSAEKREEIFKRFIEIGMSFTIGMASASEIDKLNIRRATLLAMKRAVNTFFGATFALIDAWKIPDLKILQRGIIHGDRLVKSIAAASIIAKVVRDRLMREYDKDFFGYGLARHKGYATKIHRDAIKRLGPTPLHRKTFL
ncbi:ribonuclease HII [Candidatus Peregrinibacteria bacterium]|nr:ribonuclease HII [Candidatus Peregrinibacteria bacterium]